MVALHLNREDVLRRLAEGKTTFAAVHHEATGLLDKTKRKVNKFLTKLVRSLVETMMAEDD